MSRQSAGLMLNFLPDAAPALAEMVRVTRPGRVVGECVWECTGEMHVDL
jgi:hypothetical protein